MSIQKVLKMAEKFVTMAEGGTTVQPPAGHNAAFQAQRDRFTQFHEHFARQLRIVINEMGGDLFTLKNRDFDPKMFKLFGNIYQDLISISKELKEDKPYIAAQKLVHYVTDRPTKALIDNMDFLTKQHTKSTNVDFKPSPMLSHPQIRSLDALKKLAAHLAEFMAKHPLIEVLRPTDAPPARLQDSVEPIPEFQTGPGEKTNAALPFSKKK